ncbi:hypothetical protein [Pseudomonas sp. IPO3778]
MVISQCASCGHPSFYPLRYVSRGDALLW